MKRTTNEKNVEKKSKNEEKADLAKRMKKEETRLIIKADILRDVRGYMSMEFFQKFEANMIDDLVENVLVKI